MEFKTVADYLDSLSEQRRSDIRAVREVILDNLPEGYEETIQYGMISYVVPLSLYPQGYLNKKDIPLPYASLASQKNHMALYLMNIYADRDKATEEWFKEAYKASGKKMDVGKSCVRFKKIEDLPLQVIGQAIARTPVKDYIKTYEDSRSKR